MSGCLSLAIDRLLDFSSYRTLPLLGRVSFPLYGSFSLSSKNMEKAAVLHWLQGVHAASSFDATGVEVSQD